MKQQEADALMRRLDKACALYIDSAEVIRLVLADMRQIINSLVCEDEKISASDVHILLWLIIQDYHDAEEYPEFSDETYLHLKKYGERLIECAEDNPDLWTQEDIELNRECFDQRET